LGVLFALGAIEHRPIVELNTFAMRHDLQERKPEGLAIPDPFFACAAIADPAALGKGPYGHGLGIEERIGGDRASARILLQVADLFRPAELYSTRGLRVARRRDQETVVIIISAARIRAGEGIEKLAAAERTKV
jgi:hypothetical protein